MFTTLVEIGNLIIRLELHSIADKIKLSASIDVCTLEICG